MGVEKRIVEVVFEPHIDAGKALELLDVMASVKGVDKVALVGQFQTSDGPTLLEALDNHSCRDMAPMDSDWQKEHDRLLIQAVCEKIADVMQMHGKRLRISDASDPIDHKLGVALVNLAKELQP